MKKVRKLFIFAMCLFFLGATPAYCWGCDHSYGGATYTWSDDNQTVKATRLCSYCMAHDSETVSTTSTVVQEKSCILPELTSYTASFTNTAFATQTKENIQTGEAAGHSYGDVTYTWSDDNQTVTAKRTCSVCNDEESEIVSTASTVVQEKSCILPELTSYTASFTNTAFAPQTKGNVQTGEAAGHRYGDVTYTWSDDNQTVTAKRTCSVCNGEESEIVSTTSTVVQEKSCILPELTSYTASFTNTAFATQTKENVQTGEATGHNLKKTEGVAASAAEKGNSTYWQCHDCNQYFSDEKAQNEIKKEDTVLEKMAPIIIEDDGASVTTGEKKALSFRSDAAFEDFIRLEVDGKTVDESNYTVKSGSTIVTLKEGYVASLLEGEHTLGIVSESGTATAKFVVNQKAEETKKEVVEDSKKEDAEKPVKETKDTPITEESTTTKTTPTTKTQSSQVKANPVTKSATSTTAKTAATSVTKTAPKTGDHSQMLLYISLMLASLGIIVEVGIKKKKEMEA